MKSPKTFRLSLIARIDDAKPEEPMLLDYWKSHWRYRGRTFRVEGGEHLTEEEIAIRIRHQVLKDTQQLSRMKKEVEAFENFSRVPDARRERIPGSVRMFVWQRDEGRCVECSSREHLEFDHIIPLVEGGANTERNIQLLCETCNRKKSRNI